jgi:hypothetical protein
MNIILWMAQGVLAVIMLGAGGPKLFIPRERLPASMSVVKSAPPALIKLLGLAEVLGAAGLVVPRLAGVAPSLTPLAAACLSVILLGALAAKLRRHESPTLPAIALLLSVTIAVGRALA